ncbi:4'-phosphopantetheinyl transferase family protein [Streptomyces sp. NPDC059070]|uniref:4'-phosphopantetheinyl transferase family protein n=1 Tax=Streptomyces sp. NPDC059070 TaxID=3346713 RepID=UPI00369F86B9
MHRLIPRGYAPTRLPDRWTGGPPQTWLAGPAPHDPADQHLLDDAERARAAEYARAEDQEAYVASHAALRRLLGAYLGVPAAAVSLTRAPCPTCGGPHGRPTVTGAPLHYSLSRSAGLTLLAFASTEVGADVEERAPATTAETVGTTLHPREHQELAALPRHSRPTAFTRCWTRKEAYLKATGTGLSEPPSHTYVSTHHHPAHPTGWRTMDVRMPKGFAGACVVRVGRG